MGRAEDLFSRIESQGLEAIQGMLAEAKSEEAFLDFKQSGDKGRGRQLCDSDKKNLSKALSGFANADGGVIVWGITAPSGPSGDVANGIDPLVDCRAFAARIDDKVSWGTTPPVPGVRSIAIADASGTAGFVATLIPASAMGPHQSTDSHRYLMRAGSSFQPVTHSVLAGMFGRRPQANIYTMYAVTGANHVAAQDGELLEIWLSVHAVNDTAVVARDAYMSFKVWRLPSSRSRISMVQANPNQWERNTAVSPRFTSFLTSRETRLAPFSHQIAINLQVSLIPPFTNDFKVELHCGCEGAAPFHDQWEMSLDDLNRILGERLQTKPLNGQVKPFDHEIAERLLGFGDRIADRHRTEAD